MPIATRSNGTMSSLSTWLSTLTRDELQAVLVRRPATLRGPEPRDMGELAQRLQHAGSVFEALTSVDLACLQVTEAVLALGDEVTPERLTRLLDGARQCDVEAVLARLREHALLWPDGRGRLRFAATLRDVIPSPLGLGPPAIVLLRERTVAELHGMQVALGLPRGGNKRAALDSLVQRLSDLRFLRERIGGLPAPAREHLALLASGNDPDDDFDIGTYRARLAAEQLLAERGLLVKQPWGPRGYLPAEVALALRGEEYRAPFTPVRPAIGWQLVGRDAIRAESGLRASEFADRSATVLDLVAAEPVPCLKSGGIGARELARLAKAAATPIATVRLIMELAGACGLLDAGGEKAMVTAAYDEWRDGEPAWRLTPLVSAWWASRGTPSASRDGDGKAVPVLGWRTTCDRCLDTRQVLLTTAGSAPDGHGARSVEELRHAVWWDRPGSHLFRERDDDAAPLAWTEAETLGAIARGALTSIGEALLDGRPLEEALTALIPEPTSSAAFGSDLTVVVGGAPSAPVTALLDSCADREARGAAAVWRFSPASIRRALDAGTSADELERDLTEIATTALPQPLRYLIGDVARRHGHVRVSAATSCICSPDEALLAEVAANRSLRALKLRLLAPTVAASRASVKETIAALRAAGYLPLSEDADGVVQVESPQKHRAAVAPRRSRSAGRTETTPPADPARIAERLLGQPTTTEAPVSGTEAVLTEWASGLGRAEVRQLAHAIDEGTPVRIDYRAASGGHTSRIVSELKLDPPFLVGWCHLREAERMFTLSRLLSATAV